MSRRSNGATEQLNHRQVQTTIRRRLQLLSGPTGAPAPEPTHTAPSPDGRWTAWAIQDPSTDLFTWEIERGLGESADIVRDVYPMGVAWTPDSAGFFYDRYLPYPGGHGLYFHKIGTSQRQDACLLYQPAHPDWYYRPSVSPDGCWLAVSTLNGSAANLLTIIPLVRRTVSPTYKEPVSQFVGRYDFVHWRDEELICRAVEPAALNGQLIAFDLVTGTRRTLLPPGDLPLLDAAPLGDGWAISYLNAGRAELRLLDAGGRLREEGPLPGLGTVDWLASDPAVNCLRFAYTDYARPARVYTWQPGESHPRPADDPPDLPFNPADFVTCARTVASADGVPVPLFLAHRRDVTPADRPVLLTAYGGLGYTFTPRFSAELLAWLEMGGLYVSVCARGGAELGESWHQAAVGAHKQRTFDDVLAAARWLLDEGITVPQQLGLWGVSNGGLTAGACLTQAPDLFGAVVIESGLLDMLDYHHLGRGRDWITEYGDPDDSAQRAVLAAYSPLHNVEARVYPPTLITTSDNDRRVGEAHSLRFANRLQSAQTGPAPILLRVDTGGGHGDQPSQALRLDRVADRLAFCAVHLGLMDG